jgi:predicted dehydrogenase
MGEQTVRIGIVGAGANTRARHLPGFAQIPEVELVAVANRSRESAGRVAKEFHVGRVCDNWQEVVTADDVDAVLIGTWPNLHCEVTCAALEAGKHVLCEARMARNLAEARQMLEAAQARPDLVAQLVPSPYGLTVGPLVKKLIKDRFLGTLREVVVLGVDDSFWDYSQPIHWRQDSQFSGFNVLSLGILHETLLRWAPPPVRVLAQSTTFEPKRPSLEAGHYVDVTVPDHVQVLTEMENGERGTYHFSGVALFGPGKQIHLYGSRGTIKIEFEPQERMLVGRRGDAQLKLAEPPAELTDRWRVEEDFIAAIRGEKPVELTTFATGVQYMQFTEAVARSAASGAAVSLPLDA